MPRFAVWLRQKPAGQDQALRDLQTFAAAAARWPYWSDALADYVRVIAQANPANALTLIDTLAQQHTAWRTQPQARDAGGGGAAPSFAVWLRQKPAGQDQALRDLQTFAGGAVQWPFWSDELADYVGVITQAHPANAVALLDMLVQQHTEWLDQRSPPPLPQGGGLGRLLGSLIVGHFERIAGGAALTVFGLLVALLLYFGLNDSGFYTSLAKVEQVRGFITFLFVLTTSVIIILIAIAIFWMDNTNDVKERYQHAKDLVTMVIGVLGTILGFYFGLQTSEGTMAIANPTVSEPVAQAKSKVTISAQIIGGKGPYAFNIEFFDSTGALKEKLGTLKGTADSGVISQPIDLPDAVKAGSVLYTVVASDAKGAQARANGTLVVVPSSIATQAPAAPRESAAPQTITPQAPSAPPTIAPAAPPQGDTPPPR